MRRMRIIAGDFRGRRLLAPRGLHTRPTADRVKEAIFNILGPPLRRPGERFRVLDLFAGSGALALEALSRGADEAVLVESDPEAAAAAERNTAALGVGARARILRREVGAVLRGLEGRFDWIFVDPPYEGGALDRALRLLGRSSLVAGAVVAEHDAKSPPADSYAGLALADRRRWGSTGVSFYRATAAETVVDNAPS
jgi:16S rRNA (guanine(966)-N(2))-methyltransferase RsmD